MNTADNKIEFSRTFWAGLAGFLLVWFAAASAIGSQQLLVNEGQSFFAPIAATAVIPVVAFLLLYALSSRLRHFVLALDIRTLTMLQHWRVVGFVFLPLAFFGVLPGWFAWSAGFGDVAIGLAAPFFVALGGRDRQASSRYRAPALARGPVQAGREIGPQALVWFPRRSIRNGRRRPGPLIFIWTFTCNYT